MEKQYNLKLTQSDLDILTALIDISLKTKGLEILPQITTLTTHISQGITEISQSESPI